MKKAILSLTIWCVLVSVSMGQDVMLIKNIWKGTFLNIETGTVESTEIKQDWLSARWELIKLPDGQFKIKNSWKNTFLNIEHGRLECSEVADDWLSARWGIKNIADTDAFIIYNIWKPTLCINIETGSPACSEIKDDWLSARWKWEEVEPGNNSGNRTNAGSDNPENAVNIKELLAAHNALRIEVGVPPLVWSPELAKKAQAWATELAKKNMGNDFVLEHSGSGENIAGNTVNGKSPAQSVSLMWGESEKANFDPGTRKCIPGKVCGHYSQMVWRATTEVGCGVTVNPNGKYILVCKYNPPGNYNGRPAY